MQLDDLKEYFDLFIINYLPHRDKELYKEISTFLLDYYYTHSYDDIPAAFKIAYEQQIIPPEFYDYLLLSNGFPDYIIAKLSLSEKFTLLQSFMDFNVYKGTLYSLQKISDTFNDTFNIYELFIDRDPLTNSWIFKPYLVYKNQQVSVILETSFTWDRIVNNTKYFLISKETLDDLYADNNILLPIKTNLIMLDYHNIYDYSYVMDIYTSTILNYFKDYSLILYLNDGEYKTNIITFYRLWYYIFNKLYKIDYPKTQGNFIYFDYSLDYFPINLSDLPLIKSEYDSINDQQTCRNFEKKYIDLFKTICNNNAKDSIQLQIDYETILPNDLFQYINNRLNLNPLIESNNIIDELYNSLITWFYSLQEVYDQYKYFFQVFALQLPLIQTKIQDSTSYLLIQHFKPYHVEIILNDLYESLKINDKFNNLYLDYYIVLQYKLSSASLAHQSHRLISLSSLNTIDSFPIISSTFDQKFKLLNELQLQFIVNNYKFNIQFNNQITAVNISNMVNSNLNTSLIDSIINLIEYRFEAYLKFKSIFEIIFDKIQLNTVLPSQSHSIISNSNALELLFKDDFDLFIYLDKLFTINKSKDMIDFLIEMNRIISIDTFNKISDALININNLFGLSSIHNASNNNIEHQINFI